MNARSGPLAKVLANWGLALSITAIADDVLAFAFTLVFARAFGPSGYGSSAALVSIFRIGSLVGSSLQIELLPVCCTPG
jgi:hypothetical protein